MLSLRPRGWNEAGQLSGSLMEFGVYTFVETGRDRRRASLSTSTRASPISGADASSPTASASKCSGSASITGRTTPSRARRRARRRGGADQAHPADQRRHRALVRRPGAGLSAVRDARSPVGRPGGDHGRARLVHRILSAVRLRARRLQRALRRKARPPARDSRQPSSGLAGRPARAAQRPGRLPARPATSAARVDRLGRHAPVGRARRRARPAAGACDHRRRAGAVRAAGGALSRIGAPSGRRAGRAQGSGSTAMASSPTRPRPRSRPSSPLTPR